MSEIWGLAFLLSGILIGYTIRLLQVDLSELRWLRIRNSYLEDKQKAVEEKE